MAVPESIGIPESHLVDRVKAGPSPDSSLPKEFTNHPIDEKEYVVVPYTPKNPNPFEKHKPKGAESPAEKRTRQDLVDSTKIRQPLDGNHKWKDVPGFRHREQPNQNVTQDEPLDDEPDWVKGGER